MAICLANACGVLCMIFTYLFVAFAEYALVLHIALPNYSSGPWAVIHTAAFNVLVLMLIVAHVRAATADPGFVSLPHTAIDFSDIRSSPRNKAEKSHEEWTVCNPCEAYRPPRAHHCSVCGRCVRKMDHHCPWINNCVGELNQRHFIQFLFYTALCCVYSATLVVVTWLRDHMGSGEEVLINHKTLTFAILLFIESLLFGIFTFVVFYDQVASVLEDETAVEHAMRRRGSRHTRPHRTRRALLQDVFGRGHIVCWLFPCNALPIMASNHSPLSEFGV
uniref:palmitoyltransferase ZDHHC7-like isoform X2 n=1 Tax=Myxine glutinosa TaxID=7769 RepID=UPI00358EFB63